MDPELTRRLINIGLHAAYAATAAVAVANPGLWWLAPVVTLLASLTNSPQGMPDASAKGVFGSQLRSNKGSDN